MDVIVVGNTIVRRIPAVHATDSSSAEAVAR
jgi:hypothetical protein